MDKKTKLTLDLLKKDNERYQETKKITVLDDYYINVRPGVSNRDVSSIFKEFSSWVEDKNVLKLIGDDEQIIKYFMCFIIKNQTDLFENIECNKHNNVELYNVFQILLDSHAVDDVMSSINKQDLALLYTKFNDVVKVSEKIWDVMNKMDKKSKKGIDVDNEGV